MIKTELKLSNNRLNAQKSQATLSFRQESATSEYKEHDWAKDSNPHRLPSNWNDQPMVNVCCAISSTYGLMGNVITNSAKDHKRFRASDTVSVLEHLKTKFGKEQKLAVFWDNASIHTAKIIK